MPPPTTRLTVRVTPRASRDEVVSGVSPRSQGTGLEDDVLRVRVTAAPVDGRANRALERLLAKRLGVPGRAVSVVAGRTGRRKVVEVEGLDEAEVWRRLEGRPGTALRAC